VLGIDLDRIPCENSWAYDQIIQGVRDGKIKALWVIATNGAHSWINQSEFNQVLDKLELLVVQDMYPTTETARRAHLFLPAAGWGEKEGLFINSERRFGLTKKLARAPGHALADFHIFQLIARAWGCGDMFAHWISPEAVFQILKEISRGQPCDITGIRDYVEIDSAGGIQWPWPADAAFDSEGQRSPVPAQNRRLFEDGRFYHPDGKARFIFETPRPSPEMIDNEYPFILLTGRGTSAQWHTGTRTDKSAVLRKLYPSGIYAEINPDDAERLGIAPGGQVRVSSRRGALTAAAFVTHTIQPGQIFLPMHYAETNQLTFPSFDPYSRQPSYKDCAVRLEAVE